MPHDQHPHQPPKNHGSPPLASHPAEAVSDAAATVQAKVTDAGSKVQAKASTAASRAQKLVREHPLVTVGLALGGGLVLGAVAQRLFSHRQSFGEALAEAIGLNRLRDHARKSI